MNYVQYGFGLKINSNIQLSGLSEVKDSFEFEMIDIFLNVIVDSNYSSGKRDYALYYENNTYILDFNEITYKIQRNRLNVTTKYTELFISTFFNVPLSILLLLNERILLHSSAFVKNEKLFAVCGEKGMGNECCSCSCGLCAF